MSAANWVRMRFAVVYDNGETHPPMEGRLSHGQLVAAKAINGASSVTWNSHPLETAEQFEERIIADLRELMARDAAPSPVAVGVK